MVKDNLEILPDMRNPDMQQCALVLSKNSAKIKHATTTESGKTLRSSMKTAGWECCLRAVA
jgi:O-phosphoseryl-tRNA(Cys) synthetase